LAFNRINPGIVRPDEKREFPLPVSPDKTRGLVRGKSKWKKKKVKI